LAIGVATMALSTAIFGLVSYSENAWVFFYISFFARLLQGFATMAAALPYPSIIIQEFPRNQTQYIGYFYTVMGLGAAIGPSIGSITFNLLGYTNSFYFQATYVCIIGLACVSFVPDRIN